MRIMIFLFFILAFFVLVVLPVWLLNKIVNFGYKIRGKKQMTEKEWMDYMNGR